MAFRMKPLPERPELVAALKRAKDAVDSMTPEEKRLLRAAQRKSWVVGEMMIEHPQITQDEASAIYDRVI